MAIVVAAQPALAQDGSPRWAVDMDPGVDIWYHGVAMVGFQGPGGSEFYRPDYPLAVSRARAEAGIGATPLVTAAGGLGAALSADPAFEVFHFVPLYFPGVGPTGMLDALETVAATSGGRPRVADPRAAFGATALATALPGREERDVTGRFANLLRQEWNLFFRGWWQDRRDASLPLLEAVSSRINDDLLPQMTPFLREYELLSGFLFLSLPLGREGRVLVGDPSNPWDNQVVIGSPMDPTATEATLSAVTGSFLRELCFPAVRRAMDGWGMAPSDPVAGTALSSTAAVRCGEMVLDLYAPERAPDYRRWAVQAFGDASAEAGAGEFQAAFPLPPGLEESLSDAVRGSK